jgi:hypothetical protein
MLSPQLGRNTTRSFIPPTVLDITKSERMEEEEGNVRDNEEYTNEVEIGFSIFEDQQDNSHKSIIHPSTSLLPDITPNPNQQTILQYNTGEGQEVRSGREDKCAEDIKSTRSNTLSITSGVSHKSTDRTFLIQSTKRSMGRVKESADKKMKDLDEEKKYVGYCGKFLVRVILNENK